MTDKDFDALIKDALTSVEVPPALNDKLIDKARKKKSAKIISFIKPASAFAAVFVCAVAVLSFYNSDTSPVKENIPLSEKEIHTTEATADTAESNAFDAVEEDTAERKASDAVEEDTAPEKASESIRSSDTAAEKNVNKAVNPEKKPVSEEIVPTQAAPAGGTPTYDAEASTVNEVAAEASTADAAAFDAASEETIEEAAPQKFSLAKKAAPSTLSELFEEGYDYKSVINERITAQIAIMDFPEPIAFTEITGDERFTLSEENTLTIIFPEGEIVSAEHGEQYFMVGKIVDGRLE